MRRMITEKEADKLRVIEDDSGDVIITAATVKTASLTSDEDEISAQKPVVEVMNGYTFAPGYVNRPTYDVGIIYAGAVRNGNKITLSLAFNIKRKSDDIDAYYPIVGKFIIPSSIFNRLVPDFGDVLDAKRVILIKSFDDVSPVPLVMCTRKGTTEILMQLAPYTIPLNTTYYSRYEVTFLLSDNMAA